MPRRAEAPRPSEKIEDPRQQAERFFELVKQRGELRRTLRSAFTAEEAMSYLRRGEAHDLLESLKARRNTSTEKFQEKPAKRLAKRLENEPETRVTLEGIDREIKELVSNLAVHEAVHAARHERIEASREAKRVMNEYRDLQAVDDELSDQDFDIFRRKGVSSSDRNVLKGNAVLREAVKNRLRVLVESPETARAARMAELLQYREQLTENSFAMTPSRREMINKIRNLWARGEPVMLTGSTGTGKTELFKYLTQRIYGRPLSRMIRSNQNVTPAEIFGKTGLRASSDSSREQRMRLAMEVESEFEEWRGKHTTASEEEAGRAHDRFLELAASSLGVATETFFQPGVYTDAVDHGMPFVIDEFNLLDENVRKSLKEPYNRRPGDEVVIQEDSGRPHVIKEGFVFGSTANIKSEKYKGGRFELDATESRVWAGRQVEYLPKEEAYDVLVAQLLNDRGELRLSREDATETIKRLLEAAEFSQQAFEGKQTQFYAEGAGTKKTSAVLEKAVLDPGRVRKIVSGWPKVEAGGKKFRDFLEEEILDMIRTQDYPEKDRRLLLQIFVTKEFFNGRNAKQLGISGVDEAKLKAWGWKDTPAEATATEVLSPGQVADLDPFGLRKLRAGEAADEFLEGDQADVKKVLEALRRLDPSKLPKEVRERLEKKSSADVIVAENREGREVRFDLAEIRRQWAQFYETHGLGDILKDKQGRETLPADIKLTPEQVDLIKAKAKEGYTRAVLIPRDAQKHISELKKNLTDGLEKDAQNKPIETFLGDYNDKKGVASSFPGKIETADPDRQGAYLILTNPNEALLPGSKNKSADELIAEFQAAGLSGLSLTDFLIEERQHFEETGKHLIDGSKEWTWLLSSRDAAFRVLDALWNPDYHQVLVRSYTPDFRFSYLGARSSVVFDLES